MPGLIEVRVEILLKEFYIPLLLLGKLGIRSTGHRNQEVYTRSLFQAAVVAGHFKPPLDRGDAAKQGAHIAVTCSKLGGA